MVVAWELDRGRRKGGEGGATDIRMMMREAMELGQGWGECVWDIMRMGWR